MSCVYILVCMNISFNKLHTYVRTHVRTYIRTNKPTNKQTNKDRNKERNKHIRIHAHAYTYAHIRTCIYIYIYWVHFRFGRFGDELLFGTQHVLNVAILAQDQNGLVRSKHKDCVFVIPGVSWFFRCPLNLVGVSHLSGAT